MILHQKHHKTLEEYVLDNMEKPIILNCIILIRNFIESLMDLLYKEVMLVILVAKVDSLSMEGLLMIKISQGHILVLDCFPWPIVEETQIRHNFSSRSKHVPILMENTLYLDK